MVIADFDRTLSAFRGPNGEPCEECHDIIFNKCSPTSSWSADVEAFWALTREKFGTLADKPVAQQLALTEWWWTEANAMMLRHNLTESNVVEAIHQANTVLRPGAISFLTNCISEGIPVMIVSAGLNKVIREFLRKHDTSGTLLQSPMLTIHANEMEFDADGRLCGFGKHLITTRNKRDVLHSPGASAQLHQLTHSRRHVLLLGDNINDVDVVADLPPTVKAIKIGFANRPDANVSQYLERYDVVVTEDGPMDYIQHQLLPQLVSR
jgi:HAD superfamily hydrolase (TIGR01544 family)